MLDILAPIEGEDPCGPDLRWDEAFLKLSNAVETIQAQSAAVVEDEEQPAGADQGATLQEIIDLAEDLLGRTKDIGVAALRAETIWRLQGLHAFAAAMQDLISMVDTWPGGEDGVHPRADPDDGDLFERGAPVGKLLREIPILSRTVGWGNAPGEIAVREEAFHTLDDLFSNWTRLEEPFGDALPSPRDAWEALRVLAPGGGISGDDVDATGALVPGEGGMAGPAPVDAWDLMTKTFERMEEQNSHSPTLPLLRMMLEWRDLGIESIASEMKQSGVSLEQMLDAVVRMEENRNR